MTTTTIDALPDAWQLAQAVATLRRAHEVLHGDLPDRVSEVDVAAYRVGWAQSAVEAALAYLGVSVEDAAASDTAAA